MAGMIHPLFPQENIPFQFVAEYNRSEITVFLTVNNLNIHPEYQNDFHVSNMNQI